MPPQTQVNSATLVMGVTGSGKSSLIATLAKYVWSRWKKITLYYNSDGGGFPAEIQAVQALGILKVFRMYTRDPGDLGLAFETCYRSAQGWWPKRINPATGEVEPGVEMVPPIAVRYEMYCPNGHLAKDVPAETLLTPTPCPSCRVMTTKQNMQVRRVVKPNKGFENVGAVAFDGLSSMLAWGLRDLGHRAGRMELKGEEAAIGGKVVSGDLKFGGTTRSHVGFAQSRGEEIVHLTLGIPNLVVPPVFTALTHEDVDERSLSIIGPKIAGRAKTDEAPQWFGNVMETAKVSALDGSNKEQRVLYLSEFIDPRGVRHLLKHRGSPGTMPPLLADPPGGDDDPTVAFTQVNLGVFFQMLDSALAKRIATVKEEIPDAPGLPEGIVEIGDSSIHAPQAAQPVPTAAQAPEGTLIAPGVVAPAGSPLAAAAAAPAPAAAPVVAPTVSAPRARKKAAAAPSAAPPPVPATTQPAAPPAAAAPAPAPASPQAPAGPVATGAAAAPVQPAAPAAPGPSTPAPQAPRPAPAPAAGPRPAAPPAGARPAGAAPPPGPRPAAPPTPVQSAAAPSPGTAPAAPPSAPAAAPGAPARPPAAAAPRPPAAAPRPPAPPPKPPAPGKTS